MRQETDPERIVWRAFPSWGQFSWLYFLSLLAIVRGLLLLRFGVAGWEMWIVGALILLIIAAVIRHWAFYILTPTRVIIRNGYTGHEINSVKLEMIKAIAIQQGPIAKFWSIGTIAIQAPRKNQELRLRGVKDPLVVQTKIKALLPE